VLITTKNGSRQERGGQYTLNYSQASRASSARSTCSTRRAFARYVNQAFINSFGPQTQFPYGGRPGSLHAGQHREDPRRRHRLAGRDLPLAPGARRLARLLRRRRQGSYAISGSLLQQDGVIRGSQFPRGGCACTSTATSRARSASRAPSQ
jgi:hypothetical protein